MTDDTRSLDELVRPGDIAMLTTVDPSGSLSSRPVTVAEVHGGVLAFLVDRTASWIAHLDGHPEVGVTVSTTRNDWVSVRGRTATSSDPGVLDRLWSPAANAFFEDRDDPAMAALQVSVIDGDFWSSPGGGPLGRLVAVVGAALGRDEMIGTHGDVSRD